MRKAYIQMHVAIFLWGFTGVLGRLITLTEWVLVWYRLILTILSLLIIHLFTKQIKLLPLKEILKIGGVGVIVILHWLTFYGAIKNCNVTITLCCLSSIAFFTSIMEPLFHRKKIDWMEVLFGIAAIAGIYTIYQVQVGFGYGIILAIISAFLSALFSVLNKKIVVDFNPESVVFYELTGGWVFLTLIFPIYLYFKPDAILIPDTSNWIYISILSFFCTTLAFTISLRALMKISAFTMNLSLNLEPIYGVILAFAIFKENKSLENGFYFGAAMIVLMVILHALHQYRQRKRAITSGV
jgi:drug/metabolite transporter (DMT)-like permease